MKTHARLTKSLPLVGVDVIDNQHHLVFDLANDVKNAMEVGANARSVDALLNVLLIYSFQHFETEEAYLKESVKDKAHCLEHYSYLKSVLSSISGIRNNRNTLNSKPPIFFADWLRDHIERFDRPCLSHAAAGQIMPRRIFPARKDDFRERRKHKRIPYHAVVDGEIITQCYNATHLNSSLARILDMSPGGLRLQTTGTHKIEDMLLISCTIGRNFKMKEKVKVVTAHDRHYGVKFLSPDRETLVFLTELHGAVHLSRIKQANGSRKNDFLFFLEQAETSPK